MATNCFQLPANKQAANRKIPKAEDGAFCKPGTSTLVVFRSPDPSPGGSVHALPCTWIYLCTHGSLHAHPCKWICLCTCGSIHAYMDPSMHTDLSMHTHANGSVPARRDPSMRAHAHRSIHTPLCLLPAWHQQQKSSHRSQDQLLQEHSGASHHPLVPDTSIPALLTHADTPNSPHAAAPGTHEPCSPAQ